MVAACYSTVKEGVRLFQFPKTTNKDESGRNNRQREFAGKLQVIV